MEITDVRVRKLNEEGKMKAVVSVTFKDIAHPINSDTRNKLQSAILKEYEKAKEQGAAHKE
jgi:stage V sporulation protein G